MIRSAAFAALILLFLWIGGMIAFVRLIPQTPSTDARDVDAAIVLTGGPERLPHGLDLLRAGRTQRLLISGVGKAASLRQLLVPYPGEARDLLALKDKVVLDPRPDSTVTNALDSAPWISAQHARTIRLVTASYHMPRSRLLFEHVLPDVEIIPDPVFPHDFDREAWWRNANSLRLVFLESNKYALTWLRLRLFHSP